MIRLITQLKITQPAYVYLPFGYNKNHHHIKYNILYLMHGWSMQAGDFFDCKKGNLVNLLDRMIENKDIPPLVVVSATFDVLNQPQSFMRSVAEIQVFNQVNSQMLEMMQSQTFNENNCCYAIRKNGRHNIATCEEYLFHALKIIFKYEK